MKSFSRGIVALMLVSAILLFSDLQNRNKKDDSQINAAMEQSGTADQGLAQNPGNTNAGEQLPSSGSLKVGEKFRLSLVHYVDSPNSEDCEKGIRKALADKNMVEGTDFTMKVYNAQGDISTLNSIAETIGNETWDLVFALSTPTAQLLTKKLPRAKIIFTNVGDPVAAGLGKSFQDHLPNVCGISTMSDFEGLIRLVRTLHPGVKSVGTVFTPAEINSVSYKNHLEAAARKYGVKLFSIPANTATEVMDAANSLVAQRIDVFCQISDNLTGSSSSAILKVAHDSKIPYYGFVTQQMSQGAVAVCARDYFQAGLEAGQMGIEVLSGKNPVKIPFRFVDKTDYLISIETARYYKIQVPQQAFKSFPTLKIKTK